MCHPVKSSVSWPNTGLPSTSHVFSATHRQRGSLRPHAEVMNWKKNRSVLAPLASSLRLADLSFWPSHPDWRDNQPNCARWSRPSLPLAVTSRIGFTGHRRRPLPALHSPLLRPHRPRKTRSLGLRRVAEAHHSALHSPMDASAPSHEQLIELATHAAQLTSRCALHYDVSIPRH